MAFHSSFLEVEDSLSLIFGITISLVSLVDWELALISLGIVGLLFGARFLFLKIFASKDINPLLWIAPRGLITVLLFFAIPNGMVDAHGEVMEVYNPGYDYRIPEFDQGILLFTILITSIIMTVSLIMDRGDKVKDVLLDSIKMKQSDDNIIDRIEDLYAEESLTELDGFQEPKGSISEEDATGDPPAK